MSTFPRGGCAMSFARNKISCLQADPHHSLRIHCGRNKKKNDSLRHNKYLLHFAPLDVLSVSCWSRTELRVNDLPGQS
jgi:hypothetical protein